MPVTVSQLIFILSFSFLFSPNVFAQDLRRWNQDTAPLGMYGSETFVREGQSYQKLKEPVQAYLKPSATYYASPSYMDDNNLPWMPWQKYAVKCEREADSPPLSGKVMYMKGDLVAVRLKAGDGYCGTYFNEGQKDSKLIFVKKSDVKMMARMDGDDARKIDEEARRLENVDAIAEGRSCDDPKNCPKENKQDSLQNALSGVGPSPEKSDELFDKYMDCWGAGNPNHKNYDKQYKKLLDLAGKTFRVDFRPQLTGEGRVQALLVAGDSDLTRGNPFHLNVRSKHLKCIGMIESNWDPLRQDGLPKGAPPDPNKAIGLMQQTNGNVEHINRLLNGGTLVSKGKTYKIPPQKWAVELWNSYHLKAKAILSPADYEEVTTNKATGQKCLPEMKNKMRDAPCPINSIAAMAIYQIVAELQIRTSSKKYFNTPDRDYSNDERYHLGKAVGVTHNAGTGRAQKAVESGALPEEWVNEMVKHAQEQAKEVKNYGQRLENCISAKSCEPPWDRRDKNGNLPKNKCAHICAK